MLGASSQYQPETAAGCRRHPPGPSSRRPPAASPTRGTSAPGSSEKIAADAGVTAALVNRYFGSKEKLFAEVIELPPST